MTDAPDKPVPATVRLAALVEALRVPQWVKNLFVLVALPFSGKWKEPGWPHAWAMAGGAFAVFCLLSSGVYLINDICDRESDRIHPDKCRRPIPSGRLPVSWALAAAFFVLGAAAGLLAYMGGLLYDPQDPLAGLGLVFWAAVYLLINLAYNAGLKRRPILDVLIVAMGFVFRAMAGSAAIGVPASVWLVVCTFTLCLFIALAKRRSEIAALGPASRDTRRVNRFYTLTNLEHMLSVSAGLAIISYTLYCVDQRTIARLHSPHLVWTIPLVVYGMFRYYCLTLTTSLEEPMKALYRDKVLWAVGIAWVVLVFLVLTFGAMPQLQNILLT